MLRILQPATFGDVLERADVSNCPGPAFDFREDSFAIRQHPTHLAVRTYDAILIWISVADRGVQGTGGLGRRERVVIGMHVVAHLFKSDLAVEGKTADCFRARRVEHFAAKQVPIPNTYVRGRGGDLEPHLGIPRSPRASVFRGHFLLHASASWWFLAFHSG